MPDQRQDHGTRTRYDELAASFAAADERRDRRYRRVTVWLLVITIAGAASSWLGYNANQQRVQQMNAITLRTRHNAAVTTNALCALRSDLERRVATSQAFLRDHPNGVAGIPAKTIRDGIANQQRTITALADIPCRK